MVGVVPFLSTSLESSVHGCVDGGKQLLTLCFQGGFRPRMRGWWQVFPENFLQLEIHKHPCGYSHQHPCEYSHWVFWESMWIFTSTHVDILNTHVNIHKHIHYSKGYFRLNIFFCGSHAAKKNKMKTSVFTRTTSKSKTALTTATAKIRIKT